MKTINAKEMMEEYNSMSFNAVSFGQHLMQNDIRFVMRKDGQDMYGFPDKLKVLYTMKELYEKYMYENNKNYIHK